MHGFRFLQLVCREKNVILKVLAFTIASNLENTCFKMEQVLAGPLMSRIHPVPLLSQWSWTKVVVRRYCAIFSICVQLPVNLLFRIFVICRLQPAVRCFGLRI